MQKLLHHITILLCFICICVATKESINFCLSTSTISRILAPAHTKTSVPIFFGLSNYQEWEQTLIKIRAQNSKNVVVHFRGFGGVVLFGVDYIREIEELRSEGYRITFILEGATVSMHALTSCFVDSILIKEGSYLHFHMPYTPMLDGTKDYVQSIGDRVTTQYMFKQCVRNGVLTEKEVEEVTVFHKAVFIYVKDGKIVHETGEDI